MFQNQKIIFQSTFNPHALFQITIYIPKSQNILQIPSNILKSTEEEKHIFKNFSGENNRNLAGNILTVKSGGETNFLDWGCFVKWLWNEIGVVMERWYQRIINIRFTWPKEADVHLIVFTLWCWFLALAAKSRNHKRDMKIRWSETKVARNAGAAVVAGQLENGKWFERI